VKNTTIVSHTANRKDLWKCGG